MYYMNNCTSDAQSRLDLMDQPKTDNHPLIGTRVQTKLSKVNLKLLNFQKVQHTSRRSVQESRIALQLWEK